MTRISSPSHHLCDWPVPFFSNHLCSAQTDLCWVPERGAAQDAGSCTLLTAAAEGLKAGRCRGPPYKQLLPGLGPTDQPHGTQPQCIILGSITPRIPSTSQEWLSSLMLIGGCYGAIPSVPSRRGNTKSHKGHLPLPSCCLPSFEGRVAEYQQNVSIRGLCVFTGGMPTEIRY